MAGEGGGIRMEDGRDEAGEKRRRPNKLFIGVVGKPVWASGDNRMGQNLR